MRRHLLAAGAVLLTLTLASGCGGKSDSSASGDTSTSDSPTAVASDTPSPTEADTPSDTPSDAATDSTDEATASEATDVPTAPSSAPVTGGGSASGKLDGCAAVSPELLKADIGITVTPPGMSQPSSFSDPDSTDCLYFGNSTPIVVQATTRADMDAPASSYDIGQLPGAKPIPGADRGYGYVLTAGEEGSVATVFVVKGQRALEVELASGDAITVDQCVKLGEDLVKVLSS